MTDFDDCIVCPDDVIEKHYTLVFCFNKDESNNRQILLGMKKRGFGTGKWNGFGGKIEPGETVEEGARRELEEESNLVANALVRRGYIVFNMIQSKMLMRVHVFTCTDYTGTPQESEEMKPQWYNVDSLPYQLMWPDDQYWMPLLLKETKVIMGQFTYDDDETITEHSVKLI